MEDAAKVLRTLRGTDNALQDNNAQGLSWLLGLSHSQPTLLSTIRCLHWKTTTPEDPDLIAEAEELRVLLPRGLEVLGAVDFERGPLRAGRIALQLRKELHFPSNGCIVAAAGVDSKLQYSWFDQSSLQALDVQEFDDKLWEKATFLRCQLPLRLPLYLSRTATASEYEERAAGAISNFVDDLKGSKTRFVAEGPEGTLLLISDSWFSIPCSGTLRSAQPLLTPGGHQIPAPIKLSAMSWSMTKENSALFMQHLPAKKKPVAVQLLKLYADVLCLAPSHMEMGEAINSLVLPGLCDQLISMSKMVKKNASQNPKISAFHFCPLSHPVTAIYDLSYGETEIDLVKSRTALHQRLGLPLDRPLLRVANALTTMESTSTSRGSRRLCDVHVGLPPSGVVGGTQSLIDGSYEYYHYLQDRFDDSGWGCAYRSLQTIISWFRLQYYTSVPVPTHREIQQTLVEIGDKDPSFVGSQEWIGSMDLCYVLDNLLGVTCKVLDVRSGAELPSKCRELALHFRTQGTPIMIGGGVLAYTLLGIDYNEMTGESAFLILDPHYTGGEDLKSIRNGGWCGWKRAVGANGKEFFLANRFYNLLMPQRPNTV
jgi:hypothetical protein